MLKHIGGIRMNVKVLLLSCLVAYPLAAAADEVYSWVDSSGIRHFSDKPPQGLERGQVKGEITTGKLKKNKFNAMIPYVPPTPEKLSTPINATDSEETPSTSPDSSKPEDVVK